MADFRKALLWELGIIAVLIGICQIFGVFSREADITYPAYLLQYYCLNFIAGVAVLMGCVVLIASFVFRKKITLSKSLALFGAYGIVGGFYLLGGHFLPDLWSNDEFALKLIEDASFLILPVILYSFFYHSLHIKQQRLIKYAIIAQSFCAGVIFALKLLLPLEVKAAYVIYEISYPAILALVMTALALNWRKSDKAKVYLILLGVISFCYLWDSISEIITGKEAIISALSIGGILIMIEFLRQIIASAGELLRERQEAVVIEQHMAAQLTHYDDLRKHLDSIMIIQHDLKNHTKALLELLSNGNIEETKAYLRNIGKVADLSKDIVVTGNPVMDAILTEKQKVAAMEKIAFHMQLSIDESIAIEPIDCCALLGNALDNAIEGCLRSENPDKSIYVSLRSQGNMLFGTIKNTASPDHPTNRNSSYREGHGYGLKSIGKVVEKYQGSLVLSNQDGYFVLKFTLLHLA